jgi:hypothetical protein
MKLKKWRSGIEAVISNLKEVFIYADAFGKDSNIIDKRYFEVLLRTTSGL